MIGISVDVAELTSSRYWILFSVLKHAGLEDYNNVGSVLSMGSDVSTGRQAVPSSHNQLVSWRQSFAFKTTESITSPSMQYSRLYKTRKHVL